MKYLFVLLAAFAVPLAAVSAGDSDVRVVAEMNAARTNPQAYADLVAAEAPRLGIRDRRAIREAVRALKKQRPLPPLKFSAPLAASAFLHVVHQGKTGCTGHDCRRSEPVGKRINRFGRWRGGVGENLYYGSSRSARAIVIKLLVDEGVPGRGHRKNILSDRFRLAGVAHGPHPSYGTMTAMSFASRFEPKSQVSMAVAARMAAQAVR